LKKLETAVPGVTILRLLGVGGFNGGVVGDKKLCGGCELVTSSRSLTFSSSDLGFIEPSGDRGPATNERRKFSSSSLKASSSSSSASV
jgi:hypothetical protein